MGNVGCFSGSSKKQILQRQKYGQFIHTTLTNQSLLPIPLQIEDDLLHRSIGGLTFIDSKRQQSSGTSILISPNLLLTAAHNIFDILNYQKDLSNQKITQQDYLGYILDKRSYKFYLPKNGVGDKFYQVQNWKFSTQFGKNKLQQDYALIKLKAKISLDDFPRLSQACEQCLNNNNNYELRVYGYPAIENNFKSQDHLGSIIKLKQYGVTRSFRVTKFQPSQFKISYTINTQKGQSGCPVASGNDIVAIHIGGNKAQADIQNFGRLITSDLLINLQRWGNEMGGDKFTTYVCQHICPPNPFQPPHQSQLAIQDPQNHQIPQQILVLDKIKKLEQLQRMIFKQNNYSKRRQLLSQKLKIQIEVYENKRIKFTETIISIAITYAQQAKYLKASEEYQKVISIYEENKKRDRKYAELLQRLGSIYRQKLRKFNEALSCFQKLRDFYQYCQNKIKHYQAIVNCARCLVALKKDQKIQSMANYYQLDYRKLRQSFQA